MDHTGSVTRFGEFHYFGTIVLGKLFLVFLVFANFLSYFDKNVMLLGKFSLLQMAT